MPNIKSATKRMELSRVSRSKNRSARARIRTAMKRVRDCENADEGGKLLVEAQVLLDRAATRRLYHPNAVARLKGQLTRHVNSLSA